MPLRSVLYYTNWSIYARSHPPTTPPLPVTHLTHILYAFANLDPATGSVSLTDPWADTDKHFPEDSWNDTGTNLYGCLKQLFFLKKQSRKLKVLLSVGGWTYSPNFAELATPGTEGGRRRARFAETCVRLLEDCGFDGIDVDWEYPKDETEAEAYVELLKAVRTALDAAQAKRTGSTTRFLLTVACPAGPWAYERLKVKEMDAVLDFWNLMAYDYAGSWDQTAGHQANLFASKTEGKATPFNTAQAVDYYTRVCGVDPGKIVLGMPLYGRTFGGTEGPGAGYADVGEGSWERGVWDVKALPRPGATEHYDEKIGASWSYDENTKTFVSYDTKQVVRQKAGYVLERGLGGGMWWESSGDRPLDQGSLVQTFVDGIGGIEMLDKTKNCLQYPESKYDNLRNGMAS